MAKLVPEIPDADNLKKIVIDYLQGESNRITKDRLALQAEEFNKDCILLYQSTPLTANDDFIIAILGSLNIHKNEDGNYSKKIKKLFNSSANLYEFLKNLYHDGHPHLGHLLRLIEKSKPEQSWTPYFATGAVITAGLGGFFYFKPNYLDTIINWTQRVLPNVIKSLYKTLTSLRNIPLLGIIINGIALIWTWYHTFANGTTTPMHKITRLVFKTLNRALIIGAYALSYVAEGVLTTPAAIFFVLGSAVDVLESLYTLSNLYIPDPKTSTKVDKHQWSHEADLVRSKNLNERLLNAFWVKLGAAILITASVIICCLFPPNIVISVSCVIFGWFVSLAKDSIIAKIYKKSAYDLQHNLKKIKETKEPSLCPALSPEQRELVSEKQRLMQEKIKLSEERKNLAEEKSELNIRKATYQEILTALAEGKDNFAHLLRKATNDKSFTPIPDDRSAKSDNASPLTVDEEVDDASSSFRV